MLSRNCSPLNYFSIKNKDIYKSTAASPTEVCTLGIRISHERVECIPCVLLDSRFPDASRTVCKKLPIGVQWDGIGLTKCLTRYVKLLSKHLFVRVERASKEDERFGSFTSPG